MGNFIAALMFLIAALVGSFSLDMPSEFYAGAILFFVVFWAVGLLPPVLIRFAFARKQLSRGAAFGLTILLWFVNFFILSMLRGQNLTSGHGADTWLVFLTFSTYNVLRIKRQTDDGEVAPVSADKPAATPIVTGNKPAGSAGNIEMPKRPEKENTPGMNDEAFYEQVGKEIEANNLQTGLWICAFAEADSDENRAKAIYIKLRVAQLTAEAQRAAMPTGGDEKAVSWEVVNDRWVKNIYADGDVTMTDKVTGRMWLFNANPCGKKHWYDAVAYCDNLTYAGYSDWRLPDKDELKEQFSQKEFFAGVQNFSYYWSGTSGAFGTGVAWNVYMDVGYVYVDDKTGSDGCVWPVRGGQ
jgi:hypothetical protein